MRILQLSPLWFPIAKDASGGIESFLAQLIPALQRRAYDVTLIATADSATSGALVPAAPVHLVRAMQEGAAAEYAYYEQHQLHLAMTSAAQFDVVHSHIGPSGYVLSSLPGVGDRVLHTVHTPVTPDMAWFFERHQKPWVSTVSAYQAGELARSGVRATVIHNGIAPQEFPFAPRGGQSLLFMGRVESVKGPDLAIRVARELGRPLFLAGPIVDAEFFRRTIEPHLDDRVRYVGIADHRQKVALLREAACAILPFRRNEPFGLVAIEAMMCGTPVVALARGALPELVEPGVTGYLADSEDSLSSCVSEALKLDRAGVRAHASARFEIDGVAEQYHQLYQRIVASTGSGARPEAISNPA